MRADIRQPAPRSVPKRGHDEIDIPRIVLRAMIALMAFTVIAVIAGRWSGQGLVMTPQSTAAETRDLRFGDGAGGALEVTDAVSGQVVALLSSGQDGFIRGVMRGLTRGRAVNRLAGDEVYRLTRWADGRLSIEDPLSGVRFDLNSFGADNLRAFAQLLESQEARK